MSASTIIVEHPLPLLIQLFSRATTFAGFIRSLLATCLWWLCPSWAPTVPAYKPRARANSASSLASTTSTLVDDSSVKEEQEQEKGQDELVNEQANDVDVQKRSRRLSNPFAKLSMPSPMCTPHITIMPFARRMSASGKQLANAVHVRTPFTPFTRSMSLDPAGASYFNVLPADVAETPLDSESSDVEAVEATVEASIVFDEVMVEEGISCVGVKRVTKVKRISRKAKALLRFGQMTKLAKRPMCSRKLSSS